MTKNNDAINEKAFIEKVQKTIKEVYDIEIKYKEIKLIFEIMNTIWIKEFLNNKQVYLGFGYLEPIIPKKVIWEKFFPTLNQIITYERQIVGRYKFVPIKWVKKQKIIEPKFQVIKKEKPAE
ncbi:MAG TPA: hypothetical protein PLM73_09135 [Petrotogaceae bacterium]|nr:hypothetical protein [Petrotogaceae bacterium]